MRHWRTIFSWDVEPEVGDNLELLVDLGKTPRDPETLDTTTRAGAIAIVSKVTPEYIHIKFPVQARAPYRSLLMLPKEVVYQIFRRV